MPISDVPVQQVGDANWRTVSSRWQSLLGCYDTHL